MVDRKTMLIWIKIAFQKGERQILKFRYVDDTTPIAIRIKCMTHAH